ncbi:hypothetical protein HMPREF3232_00471 [Fannyhessea vaginae]|jgi:hypothetical protein|nr:hypothetical protein HMPREF3232_00471 [Fannyhessea vaginae]
MDVLPASDILPCKFELEVSAVFWSVFAQHVNAKLAALARRPAPKRHAWRRVI